MRAMLLVLAMVWLGLCGEGAGATANPGDHHRGVSMSAAQVLHFAGWAGHVAGVLEVGSGRCALCSIAAQHQDVVLPWAVRGPVIVSVGNVTYVLGERDAMWD